MRLVSAIRRNSSLIAKIFRLVIYILIAFCLGYQILQLRENLTIFSRESLVQSTEIPFPGVTVCPPYITNKKTLDHEYLKQINLTEDALNYVLLLICPIPNIKVNAETDEKLVDVLLKISPDLKDSIVLCRLDDHIVLYENCDKLLVKSVTDYGLCYTFNMLGHDLMFNQDISADFDTFKRTKITKTWNVNEIADESRHGNDKKSIIWNLDTGYISDDEFAHPARASKLKTFMLSTKEIKDKVLCDERERNYKLILHLPNELPQISYKSMDIPLGKDQTVMISADVTSAEKTLLDLTPESRGCYFEGEKPLTLFRSYTKNNCEYECMTSFVYSSCGCVIFSMPRTMDMKSCKFHEYSCAMSITEIFPKSYYKIRENRMNFPDYPCGCLPHCTGIDYKVVKIEQKDLKDGTTNPHSSLEVIFTESQIKKTSHFVTSKTERFIIDVGSSIGLFLGIAGLMELILLTCKHGRKAIKMCRSRCHAEATNQFENVDNNMPFGVVEMIVMPEIRVSNDQGEDIQIEDLE